jgi:two-component system cell cycle sensor histidine kinase/response regulator CckA
MNKHSRDDLSPRLLLFVFASLVTVILAAGYYYYKVEEQNYRENEHNDIAAVAELKAGQIVRWRYEREGDALMIQNNRAIAREIDGFLRRTVPVGELRSWVESFREYNGYLSVSLFDANGHIRFSAGRGGDTIGHPGWLLLRDVFRNKKIFLSDLRISSVTQTAVMDLFVPIFAVNGGRASQLVGVLRLCIDPSKVLYPLVQSWPSPSKTGETLLLRPEGDEIIFLNDLRHRKESALKLRLPSKGDNFVAAMACRGVEGLVRGVDYRDVPVLAVIRKIPGSTWIMVAKVDEAEIYEPLQRQALFIISFVVLAIVAAGSITGWWWRNQRAAFFRRQYQAEVERRALVTRFEYLLKHANDIILLTDARGVIVEANDKAVSTYGYTGTELSQMTIEALHGVNAPSDLRAMETLSPVRDGLVYETTHRRKDRTEFPVELSLKAVDIEGTTYYQAILRDITERKRTETSLKEREALLRESQRVGRIGSYILDLSTGGWTSSEMLDEIFGIGPEQQRTMMTWEMILHPEHREEMLRYFRDEVVGTGKPFDREYRIVRVRDGVERWVWGRGELELDDDGRPVKMIGTIQDVTERRLVEDALRANEQLMKVALAPINMAVFSQDKDLRYTWIYRPQLGYKQENVVGKTDEELLPAESAGIIQFIKRKVLETGIGAHEEISLRWQGGVIHYDLVVEPLRDSRGSIIGITGAMLDISDRKRSEEALRASEQKFRDIFTWAPIGIYQSTKDGKILMANESLTHLLGYEKIEELQNLSLEKDIYYSATERNSLIDKYDRVGAGFASNIELQWKKKNGFPVWISLTAHAVRNAAGNTLYYEGFVHDITERKTMEEQVRQAQKLESVGTLASGIAHDFNNILGIILGHTTLLNRNVGNQGILKSSTESITKAAERGAMLVRQVLTFAKKTESYVESVQVNEIIAELIKLMQETFPKSISVSQYLARDLPPIRGDGTQLHQVFLNLCVNARDAMPNGGMLSVATDAVSLVAAQKRFPGAGASRYVRIVVSDTGSGMDEVTRQRIFEPFFTTKGPGKGTGLGMSVVYGIVESHGGFIDVDSIVGTGTTFTIMLPVPQNLASRLSVGDREETVPRGNETILIAEDEEMLREVLQSSLEEQGYRILVAANGHEALQLYEEHSKEIALVISDVGLPGMTGDKLFLAMKKINPSVKMILSSGFLEAELKIEIIRQGVREFVQKPYVLSDILSKTRKVIDSVS